MRSTRRITLASLVALGLLGAACGGGGEDAAPTPTGAGTGTATGGGGAALELIAVDNEFQPADFTVSAGQELMVTNNGAALHNVSIAENSVDFDINAGETETEDAFEGLAPGEYSYICKYHEALGMVGTVTVEG